MNFKLGMYFIHLVFIISTKYKSVLGKTEKRLRLQSETLGTLYSRTNSVSDVSYSHFLLSPFQNIPFDLVSVRPLPNAPVTKIMFRSVTTKVSRLAARAPYTRLFDSIQYQKSRETCIKVIGVLPKEVWRLFLYTNYHSPWDQMRRKRSSSPRSERGEIHAEFREVDIFL